MRMKGKVMLMSVAIFLPVLLAACSIAYSALAHSLVRASADTALRESYGAQLYVDRALENTDKSEAAFQSHASLIAVYLSEQQGYRIQAYDVNGNLLADSVRNELSLPAGDIQEAVGGKKAWTVDETSGQTMLLLSFPVFADQQIVGVLRFLRPLTQETQLMQHTMWTMVIVILLAALLAWILAGFFADALTTPLRKLQQAAARISQGNYKEPVAIESGDEVEALARDFDKMRLGIRGYIEGLEQERRKQKMFLDSVTHEFKTPLTAIIGYAELIPRLQDEQARDRGLRSIHEEGRRLLKLVEELLALSRLGRAGFSVTNEEAPLAPLIREVVREMKPRLAEADIHLELMLTDAVCRFDRDKTKQVFLNILDNALRYSECMTIEILMAGNDRCLEVHILDDGIGMTGDLQQALLDPVKRLRDARQAKGNGLGLAICREIMMKQGGSIDLYSHPSSGTEVVLGFMTGGAA